MLNFDVVMTPTLSRNIFCPNVADSRHSRPSSNFIYSHDNNSDFIEINRDINMTSCISFQKPPIYDKNTVNNVYLLDSDSLSTKNKYFILSPPPAQHTIAQPPVNLSQIPPPIAKSTPASSRKRLKVKKTPITIQTKVKDQELGQDKVSLSSNYPKSLKKFTNRRFKVQKAQSFEL